MRRWNVYPRELTKWNGLLNKSARLYTRLRRLQRRIPRRDAKPWHRLLAWRVHRLKRRMDRLEGRLLAEHYHLQKREKVKAVKDQWHAERGERIKHRWCLDALALGEISEEIVQRARR